MYYEILRLTGIFAISHPILFAISVVVGLLCVWKLIGMILFRTQTCSVAIVRSHNYLGIVAPGRIACECSHGHQCQQYAKVAAYGLVGIGLVVLAAQCLPIVAFGIGMGLTVVHQVGHCGIRGIRMAAAVY